jgi:hypothetical protein
MIRLRAKESFPYDNRTRHAGEIFEAPENDAHVLTTIGKAELETPLQPEPAPQTYADKIMKPEKPEEKTQTRGRYNHRAMRAKE